MALTFSSLSLASQSSSHLFTSGYLVSTGSFTRQHSSTSVQTSTLYNATISTSFHFSGASESLYSTPSAVASSSVLSSMEQSRSPQVLTKTSEQSQSLLSLSTFSSIPGISVMSTPSLHHTSSVESGISQLTTTSLLSLPTMTETPHSQLQTRTFILQTSSAAGSHSILLGSSGHSSVSSDLESVLSSLLMVSSQVPSSTLYSSSAVDASSLSETLQSTLLPSPTVPMPTSVMGSTPLLSSLPSSDYASTLLPSLMSTADLSSVSSASALVDVSSSPVLMTSNPTTQAPVVTTEPQNQSPILQHPIDVISTVQGDVLTFQIPPDTFYDAEDGSTHDLLLTLLTVDNNPVSMSSWLQLDSGSGTLSGVPLDNNLTRTRNEYLLSATDSQGLVAYDAFVVQVQRRPSDFTHEFIITLENDFQVFVSDQRNIVKLCQEIVGFLGDGDTGAMSIRSVEEGSVEVSYSNKTISREFCDQEAIDAVYANLADSDGLPKSAFQAALAPDFIISSVDLVLLHQCTNATIPSPTNGTRPLADESSILLVTVIPAVIIAALLLICFIIVCCFYKRNRGGEEFLLPNEKPIYAKNRKPVYLEGELEDKGLRGISNPVVLPVDLEFLQSSKPLRHSGRPPTKQQPPPPQYRLPDYARVDLEMDDFMVGAHMIEPPEYSSQPFLFSDHGTKTISAVSLPSTQSDKSPPHYQLPPLYQSQDAGFFNDSDI